ncbi:MAG: M20 family metallopeptidase [Acidobacteria bacterium]|nr:M20 family metallopeptidase [Acidobacteriota bacterium]
MLAMLRSFVETESPSTDKSAVDRFSLLVARACREGGAQVRWYESRETGNHLRAAFTFPGGRRSGQILLLGHMDTVWPLGTLERMPVRISRGRAYGPGIFDMKAGIVCGLFALQALRELRVSIRKHVVLLLTADEEIGSRSSRPWIEKEARRSDCALVLEPAHELKGALKTARKGVGDFEIRVEGRSAHAGLEPEKGASAVMELCRQILCLEMLANSRKRITMNAGIISGGTRSNVIPAEAIAHVDVRVGRASDMQRVARKLYSLKPFDRRTKLIVTGAFNRPPLERTADVARLFECAQQIGDSLGITLEEAAVGGGSDGNFTAGVGTPTLDGLGAVGEGAHAANENIVIRELPRRAALLAHLIAQVGNE